MSRGDDGSNQVLPSRTWNLTPRLLRASPLHGLTTQGRSVIAAGLVVAAFSVLLGEKGLLPIAALLVTLPLLAVLSVFATRVPVWCQRRINPARVCAQQPTQVRLQLHARRRSGQLQLEDTVPADLAASNLSANTAYFVPAAGDSEVAGPRFRLARLQARSTAELEYQVLPRRRGHYVVGPLTVQRSDPFGMCTLLQPVSSAQTLIVTPAVTPLPLNPLIDGQLSLAEHRVQTLSTYGDDAATVRTYRPGDDPRRVHWRSSARAGELMVRQQEQLRHARATVMLDTRAVAHHTDSPHNDPSDSSFEWAVAATASITAHLVGQGLRVRLLTDTGRQVASSEPESGNVPAVDKSRQIMDFLAGVTLSDRGGLRGGVTGAGDTDLQGWEGESGVAIAVVGALSADDAAWLSQSQGDLGRHSGPAVAVVVDGPSREPSDIDGWPPGAAAPGAVIPGWRTVHATPGSDIATLWRDLALAQTTEGPAG